MRHEDPQHEGTGSTTSSPGPHLDSGLSQGPAASEEGKERGEAVILGAPRQSREAPTMGPIVGIEKGVPLGCHTRRASVGRAGGGLELIMAKNEMSDNG